MENTPQTPYKSKYKLHWEKQKEKGFWSFCLKEGLIWGLITGLLSEIFKAYIVTRPIPFNVFNIFGFAIFGFLVYAPVRWYMNNKLMK